MEKEPPHDLLSSAGMEAEFAGTAVVLCSHVASADATVTATVQDAVVAAAPAAAAQDAVPAAAAQDAVPVAVANDGVTGINSLGRDCLTVVFYNLSPITLLLCSQVCGLWRRTVSQVWQRQKSLGDASYGSLISWLRDELHTAYLPYRRMSYYDRLYNTPDLRLQLTWPRRPMRLLCLCRDARDNGVGAQFAKERIAKLFGIELHWAQQQDEYRVVWPLALTVQRTTVQWGM